MCQALAPCTPHDLERPPPGGLFLCSRIYLVISAVSASRGGTGKKWPLNKGPSSAYLVVMTMATMLDHAHALRAIIAPVSIMVSVTTHFDTHTVTIAIAMHF